MMTSQTHIDLRDRATAAEATRLCPAVMAEAPTGMSEGYQFMSSAKLAIMLHEKFGLNLVKMSQQHSRKRKPEGQEHVMRFRLPFGGKDFGVGDSVPELVIMNSHNGRSTIRAYAGVFRMVCSNGLVAFDKDGSLGEVRARHFGTHNSYEDLSKLISALARKVAVIGDRIKKMDSITLTPHMQNRLARRMMEARGTPGWAEPADLLEARREQDERAENGSRSLWLTFNVLQENLTNVAIQSRGEGRVRSMRPITGARASVLVNEKLWQTMEEFMEELETGSANKRSFDDLIKLERFADFESITTEELQSLSKEERTKLVKRKSYIKRKEAA